MKPEIIEVVGSIPKQGVVVLCICPKCGNEFTALRTRIINGERTNCGCKFNARKLSLTLDSGIEIHKRWRAIKSRVKSQYSYIKKGITVCDEWVDFKTFYDWAIMDYKPGLEIDRINNKGNYSPDNCRWITRLENLRNRDKQTINEEIAFKIKIKLLNGESKRSLAKEFNCSLDIVNSLYTNKAWRDICEKAERQWLLDNNTLFLPEKTITIRPKRGKYNIAVRSKTSSAEGRRELCAEYRKIYQKNSVQVPENL